FGNALAFETLFRLPVPPFTLHKSLSALQHSITPSLHHSITPLLHHSITPLLDPSVRPHPHLRARSASAKVETMKCKAALLTLALLPFTFSAFGQTMASSSDKTDAATIEALSKKIDLQNAKIDALSQQILKLQQQISGIRPGIMIGETPAPVTASTEPAHPIQ